MEVDADLYMGSLVDGLLLKAFALSESLNTSNSFETEGFEPDLA